MAKDNEITLTADGILRLCRLGVASPREGAAAVLDLGIPKAALIPMAALVSALVAGVRTVQGFFLAPPEITQADGTVQIVEISPLIFALLVLAFIVLYSWGLDVAGRKFGGMGTYAGALILMCYLQTILIGFQLVSLVFLVIGLTPIASIIAMLGFLFSVWLNIVFVDVLHGYNALMKSFMLIMAVSAALLLGMMTILTLSGVSFAG